MNNTKEVYADENIIICENTVSGMLKVDRMWAAESKANCNWSCAYLYNSLDEVVRKEYVLYGKYNKVEDKK